MNDQTQAQTNQAPQIRIGFEATLEMFNPNWRTEFTPPQVDAYRFFYQSALRDFTPFLAAQKQTLDNMIQGYQFMDANAAQTTNVIPEETKPEVAPTSNKAKLKAASKVPVKPAVKGKTKR